ncbi:DNA-directed RNA polymerase subunit H [Candidatus Woesearchaeota archaeon]|nr:DNA-directed RNA polymerase subunit H [Candidatus Woesearchaeota archaeon]
METQFNITEHFLVPEHIKLTEEEKTILLNKYNITIKQLPMIDIKDPALKDLNPKVGEVIKIVRWSPTSKTTEFYRVVVDG